MASPEQWDKIRGWAKKILLMTDGEKKQFVEKVLSVTKDLRQQSVFIFFYLYGLRPEELLELRKSDFSIRENEVIVVLPTAKGGQERMIHLDRNKTPFLEILVKFVEACPIADWRLFREFNHPTAFNKVLEKVENAYFRMYNEEIYLAPYIFRKFRISYLWSLGAGAADVLAWKGGKSIKVVEDSYTILKPVTKFSKQIK
jgi:integrase